MMSMDAIERELFQQQKDKVGTSSPSSPSPASSRPVTGGDGDVSAQPQQTLIDDRKNASGGKNASTRKTGDSKSTPTVTTTTATTATTANGGVGSGNKRGLVATGKKKKKFVLSSSSSMSNGDGESSVPGNNGHSGYGHGNNSHDNNGHNGNDGNSGGFNGERHSREITSETQNVYKSAGILPFAFHPTTRKLHFLLGKETRGKDRVASWSEFGGKKEEKDRDSIHTAAREFCEETVAVFQKRKPSGEAISSQLSDSISYVEGLLRSMTEKQLKNQSIYYPGGKYCLYLLELPYIEEHLLEKAVNDNLKSKAVSHAEKNNFKWVEASHLFNVICPKRSPDAQSAPQGIKREAVVLSPDEVVSRFFCSMFRYGRFMIRNLISYHSSRKR